MYLKILENNKGKPNSKLINGKKIKIKQKFNREHKKYKESMKQLTFKKDKQN